MWDAVTGAKQYTFEGHEAPVYSVCPHHKENIQVMLLNLVYSDCKASKLRCYYFMDIFPPFFLCKEDITVLCLKEEGADVI